jgi:hypothetical protein
LANDYSGRVFTVLTAAIELSSAATDVWFTTTTLASLENQHLFISSISILAFQLFLRLCIALMPLLLFRDQTYEGNTSRIFGDGSDWKKYVWGLILTLVSPLNGVEIINTAMNLTPAQESNKVNAGQLHALDLMNRAYQLQVGLLCTSSHNNCVLRCTLSP